MYVASWPLCCPVALGNSLEITTTERLLSRRSAWTREICQHMRIAVDMQSEQWRGHSTIRTMNTTPKNAIATKIPSHNRCCISRSSRSHALDPLDQFSLCRISASALISDSPRNSASSVIGSDTPSLRVLATYGRASGSIEYFGRSSGRSAGAAQTRVSGDTEIVPSISPRTGFQIRHPGSGRGPWASHRWWGRAGLKKAISAAEISSSMLVSWARSILIVSLPLILIFVILQQGVNLITGEHGLTSSS